MAGATPDAAARVRLQRLAKGALFVGITAGYALLLGLTLVLFGWRPALLAVFFVLTGQGLRHIASEADRIGVTLAGEQGAAPDTRDYQKRMLRIFTGLTQLPNAALVAQAFALGGPPWGTGAAAMVLTVESLYLLVWRLNRRTAFEEASYGFRDRSPLSGVGARIGTARDRRVADVERRLDELRALVEDGKVSPRAYEKACDRWRVRAVMTPDRG